MVLAPITIDGLLAYEFSSFFVPELRVRVALDHLLLVVSVIFVTVHESFLRIALCFGGVILIQIARILVVLRLSRTGFRPRVLLLLLGKQFDLYQLQEQVQVAVTQFCQLVGRKFALIDQLRMLEVHQALNFILVVIEIAGDFVKRCADLGHRHLAPGCRLPGILLSSELHLT